MAAAPSAWRSAGRRGALKSAPIQHDAPERTGTDASGSQHQVSTSASALDFPRAVRASDLHVCAGGRRVVSDALPFGEHLAPDGALQRERASGLRHRRGLLPLLPGPPFARPAQGPRGPRHRLTGAGGPGRRDRRLYPGAAGLPHCGGHDRNHLRPHPHPRPDGRSPGRRRPQDPGARARLDPGRRARRVRHPGGPHVTSAA